MLAVDVETHERTAKHYLQHVINAANMEFEATQAVGLVLGMPSSTGSNCLDHDERRAC